MPIPLSATAISASSPALRPLTRHLRRDVRGGVLDRVAQEVEEDPLQLARDRPRSDGQRADLDGGAALGHRGAQVAQRAGHQVADVDALQAQVGRPGARIEQQVVDHALHALDAVDRVRDELAGLVVEAIAVLALEQRDEARDRAQRLGEVVRGDVGEGLEVGVGALELGAPALALDHASELDADLVHDVQQPGIGRRVRPVKNSSTPTGRRPTRIGKAKPARRPATRATSARWNARGPRPCRSPMPTRPWPMTLVGSPGRVGVLAGLAEGGEALLVLEIPDPARAQGARGPDRRGRRARRASACARRRARSRRPVPARSPWPRSTPRPPSRAARARPGGRRAAARSRRRGARPRAGPPARPRAARGGSAPRSSRPSSPRQNHKLPAPMAVSIAVLPGDGIGPRSPRRRSRSSRASATSCSPSTRSAARRSMPTEPL